VLTGEGRPEIDPLALADGDVVRGDPIIEEAVAFGRIIGRYEFIIHFSDQGADGEFLSGRVWFDTEIKHS
jgi:hypothetical protein